MYFNTCRDFLVEGAKNAINVDARVSKTVKTKVITNPTRYTFEEAEVSLIIMSEMRNNFNKFICIKQILKENNA